MWSRSSNYCTTNILFSFVSFCPETHVVVGTGWSDSPTAASFVRPSRPHDKPLSFLEALRKKYASDQDRDHDHDSNPYGAINISGKTVEEIGFDKIRQQQAHLQNLAAVSLDSCSVHGIGDPSEQHLNEFREIKSLGLQIVTLELSRNLLEDWLQVIGISDALGPTLRELDLEYISGSPFTGCR